MNVGVRCGLCNAGNGCEGNAMTAKGDKPATRYFGGPADERETPRGRWEHSQSVLGLVPIAPPKVAHVVTAQPTPRCPTGWQCPGFMVPVASSAVQRMRHDARESSCTRRRGIDKEDMLFIV